LEGRWPHLVPSRKYMCHRVRQVRVGVRRRRRRRRRRRFMAHEYQGARAVPAAYLSGGAGGSLRQALAATPPLAPPPRLQHCNTYSPECPTPTCSSGSARHDTAPQSSSDRQRYRNGTATQTSSANTTKLCRSSRCSLSTTVFRCSQCMCFPDRRQFDVHVAAPGTY
jgi:hypothetical protein